MNEGRIIKSRRSPEARLKGASISQAEAQAYELLAINRLRTKGFRITMPRVQVIRVLALSNQALSAYAIHERILAMGGRIDVVSVYRILATLSEISLIHHVGVVDGYLACRFPEEHPEWTEHVVCSNCGTVSEVELPEEVFGAISGHLRSFGFESQNAKLEITGLCADCAAA